MDLSTSGDAWFRALQENPFMLKSDIFNHTYQLQFFAIQ